MKGRVLITIALVSLLSLLAVLVVAQVQQIQPPRPGKEVLRKSPAPPPKPEERIKQMLDRIMSRMNLNEEQKKAVEDLVMAKIEARRKSQEGLKELRRLARDRNASEDQIKTALDKFRKNLIEIRTKVQKLEETALKIVPVRAQLMLTLTGIFDNGQPFPPQPRARTQRPLRRRPGRGGTRTR